MIRINPKKKKKRSKKSSSHSKDVNLLHDNDNDNNEDHDHDYDHEHDHDRDNNHNNHENNVKIEMEPDRDRNEKSVNKHKHKHKGKKQKQKHKRNRSRDDDDDDDSRSHNDHHIDMKHNDAHQPQQQPQQQPAQPPSDIILYNNDRNAFQRFLSSLDAYDKYYSSFIHNLNIGLWMDFIFLLPTFLFSFIGIFLVTLVYAYFLHTLSYLIFALITLVVSELIKYVFRRPRPNPNNMTVKRIVNLSGILIARASTSMPSGDTMQAGVLAICLGFATPLTYWWLLVIPFVGFGRMYFQKHFLGDVLVGGFLGIVLGLILNASLDEAIKELHF